MASDNLITFYDIASAEPRRTFAPNPWKTRFALNLKGLAYKTEWVHMPDITATREKLGVPANRTLPDGSPYHTLPLIHDETTKSYVGDTFEIALHLDKTYPNLPTLIESNVIGLTAAFNQYVDGIFTPAAALCDAMPFDPAVAERVGAMFAKRFGVAKFEDMKMSPEAREAVLTKLQVQLAELAKAYRHTGGTTDYIAWKPTAAKDAQRAPEGHSQVGPFLDGEKPTYADLIVGGWLKMFEASMSKESWETIAGWNDGLWARVVKGLEPWAQIK